MKAEGANRLTVLPPVRLRFCEQDHEQYGDGWYVYDEAALTRLPAGELVALEAAVKAGSGLNLPGALTAVRLGDVLGDLIVMFIARWMAGERDGSFVDFNPLVWAAEYEPVPEVEQGEQADADDAGPPDLSSSSAPVVEE